MAEVVGGDIRNPHYQQIITRLGGGMTKQEGLTPAAMERTLFALKNLAASATSIPAERMRVVATEAMRRAVNAASFIQAVQQQTGLTIDVISGEEEARLTTRGVLSILQPLPTQSLVFDIGGGSTEFILLQGEAIQFQKSYPLGVVDLAEQASSDIWNSIIDATLRTLAEDLSQCLPMPWPSLELIGTAGTMTTLAALALRMQSYDRSLVNNHILERTWLRQTLLRFSNLSPAQREQLPGIEPGRGDLILPGLAIVLALLSAFEVDQVRVSDAGLLEGILLSGECRS